MNQVVVAVWILSGMMESLMMVIELGNVRLTVFNIYILGGREGRRGDNEGLLYQ